MTKVWIRSDVILRLHEEANDKAPLETGGVLLGYTGRDCGEYVILRVLGPGPCAIHKRERFVPDHDYHLREISNLYARSGHRLTYLGDWHTHPFGSTTLSRRDERTLQRIAKYGPARIATPLMLIMGGHDLWEMRVWMGRLAKRFCFVGLTANELEVLRFVR